MATTLPEKMKAAALDRFGGPEVLGVHTLPLPECGEDELLVRVDAAGVGAWDPWEREGEMADMVEGGPKFPYVPGSDGAGEVVAVGGKVKRFKVGDRVYAYEFGDPKGGFYAEYAAVKEDNAAPIPSGMTVEEAGALGADGITALCGLEELDLQEGQTLLVFGANGGIGHIALQLARRMGAKVLAVASGEDGVELARRLGADAVVEGHDANDVEEACRAFAPDGVDAALVLACSATCQEALRHVRQGGRIAFPNGVDPEPRAPKGVELKSYDGVPSVERFQKLNALIEAGPFHVNIGKVYALEEAARAQQEVSAHHLGKLALKIH